MKKNITLILFIVTQYVVAQIYLGNTNTTINNSSILLHFEKTNDRGILLPTVSELPTNPSNGTILLDAVNANQARVKFRNNGTWFDLSLNDGDASLTRNTKVENTNSKVVLGAESSAADGVLVLESTTQVMELPRVESTDQILSPSAGMMVYVNSQTVQKPMLAVFNGTNWTFWSYSDPGITIDPPK